MKIIQNLSVLVFYRYIENILVFTNYSKFKDIFNLYIKIILQVYKIIISIRFENKTLKFLLHDLYKIIGSNSQKNLF